MAELPPPPVPPEADLTHYDDMPLVVRRLRDSGIAGESNAEVFRCAVLLWCVAWHQIPAGSLPNSEIELCRLVGLGRDLRTWRKVRAGALRGWRLFSDGRLYHHVVSEKVVEGWNRTLIMNWRLACDRVRKENKSREERGLSRLPMPEKSAVVPFVWPSDNSEIPPERSANSSGKSPERNRRESNRREERVPPLSASPPASPRDPPADLAPEGGAPPVDGPQAAMVQQREVDEAFRLWGEVAFELKIPDVGFMNADRRAALAQRLSEVGGLPGWAVFLEKVREAKFFIDHRGRPKHWVRLGKLLEAERFTSLMEDSYADLEQRDDHRKKRSGAGSIASTVAAFAKAGSG